MDSLESYREQIDAIDAELIALLKKRLQIAEKIGMYKKANNIDVLDKSREHEIIEKLSAGAKEHDLSEKLLKEIWQLLFEASYSVEEK